MFSFSLLCRMFESSQARFAASFLALQTVVVLIIIGVMLVFFKNVLKKIGGETSSKTIVMGVIVPFLILIVFNLITIFDVNCSVSGNCGIWAWIKSIFIVIGSIMSVVSLIMILVALRKIPKVKEQKEEFKDFVV